MCNTNFLCDFVLTDSFLRSDYNLEVSLLLKSDMAVIALNTLLISLFTTDCSWDIIVDASSGILSDSMAVLSYICA